MAVSGSICIIAWVCTIVSGVVREATRGGVYNSLSYCSCFQLSICFALYKGYCACHFGGGRICSSFLFLK